MKKALRLIGTRLLEKKIRGQADVNVRLFWSRDFDDALVADGEPMREFGGYTPYPLSPFLAVHYFRPGLPRGVIPQAREGLPSPTILAVRAMSRFYERILSLSRRWVKGNQVVRPRNAQICAICEICGPKSVP